MLACKNGHVEAVRELLLAGANPNHQKQVRIPRLLWWDATFIANFYY